MYDAIIIGSGIGGLSTAGFLAGTAGKRVLVLEKHSVPGGLTHAFRRGGASWDVGVHYLGGLGEGEMFRRAFDYLTGGQVHWRPMPRHYDRFVYPGIDFRVPARRRAYEDALIAAFPHEARAVRRYFRDIGAAASWGTLAYAREMVPRSVEPLIRLAQRVRRGPALDTTRDYLERRFRDPRLRALLASQWGDYGVEPARSAFVAHATVVAHYLEGAWFPEGGSARIARAIEDGIEARGGRIRVCQEVREILVENGRAVGVRVIDRSGPRPREAVHRAPVVVSGAGAGPTYNRLLPTDGPVGAATRGVRGAIDEVGPGLSAVSVYLELSELPDGVDGSNVWVSTTTDHDDIEGATSDLLAGGPRAAFCSFPSIKAGEGRATAEILAFADPRAFQAWEGTAKGDRGADYARLKAVIADGLIALADSAVPGLRAAVRHVEVGTPLTVEHYTSHPAGAFYGIPATPERYRKRLTTPRTPIEGLYLTGQDAGFLGIAGALMAGMSAACQVLGPAGHNQIMRAIKEGPGQCPGAGAAVAGGKRQDTVGAPGAPGGERAARGEDAAEPGEEHPLPVGKRGASVVSSRAVTPSVVELLLDLDDDAPRWWPGQYVRLRVADHEWRDYSIASLEGRRLRLLIDTRTRGRGARFAVGAAPGARTLLEGPFGSFTATDSPRRRVFVATGTGLAPFLPVFAQDPRESDRLLFGCRTSAEDLTRVLDDPMPPVTRCITREDVDGAFRGRVTAALAEFGGQAAECDFHVCGSSEMVADAMAVLRELGAGAVVTEAF